MTANRGDGPGRVRSANVELGNCGREMGGITGTYTATITPVRWICNPASERLSYAWVSYSVP